MILMQLSEKLKEMSFLLQDAERRYESNGGETPIPASNPVRSLLFQQERSVLLVVVSALTAYRDRCARRFSPLSVKQNRHDELERFMNFLAREREFSIGQIKMFRASPDLDELEQLSLTVHGRIVEYISSTEKLVKMK